MSEIDIKVVHGNAGAGGTRDGKIARKLEKLEKLTSYIRSLSDQSFTGYIKINYSEGSIGRIEKFEEILKK